MTDHPNAIVGGGAGAGGGALIVWVLGLTGVSMTPEIGALIAGAASAAALLVGRKGLKGILHGLWIGNGK